jgi:hypothetical protein
MAYNVPTWSDTHFDGGDFESWAGGAFAVAGQIEQLEAIDTLTNYSTTTAMNSAIATAVSGVTQGSTSWMDPVHSAASSAPGSPTNGDRHIATATATWGSIAATAGDILEYTSGAWVLEFDYGTAAAANDLEGYMVYNQTSDSLWALPSGNAVWVEIGSALGGLVALDTEVTAAVAAEATLRTNADTTLTNAVALNTNKVTNVSTNLTATGNGTSLTVHSSDGNDVALPVASTSAWGVMSDDLFDALALNTAKATNVSTTLVAGTINATTYGITSDGGADDIVLPEATASAAGLLGASKWTEIGTATSGVSTNLASIGTIGNIPSYLGTNIVGAIQQLSGMHDESFHAIDAGNTASNEPYDTTLSTLDLEPDKDDGGYKHLIPGAILDDSTIELPGGAASAQPQYEGFTFTIKLQALAAGKKITVSTAGSETIDGNATFVIDQAYACVSFHWVQLTGGNSGTGTGWVVC